jgi:hypothetical protein
MGWLQTQRHLSVEANLRLRLGNASSRGIAFEEVGVLYLLRALRYSVPLTTIFDFRCAPSWANEMARIVARQDNKYISVDVLGRAPENPGLSVVHHAPSIQDIIDWLDKLDTASVLLIPNNNFGPDVMARCRLSPSNTIVLLMGQFKSFTVGNKNSLDARTTKKALESLHRDHWFIKRVCCLVSLSSLSH